jgi:hypothetical protein
MVEVSNLLENIIDPMTIIIRVVGLDISDFSKIYRISLFFYFFIFIF